MLKWLWIQALSKVFGDGFGADVAARGTTYLAGEARKAIDRDEQQLTKVRLRPGETYTIVARPAATKRERKLSAEQARLRQRDDRLSRPTRSQLKAARKLAKAQHRLDRRRVGSRRAARAAAEEATRAVRFDKVMTPTRKQIQTTARLHEVSADLEANRRASFDAARARTKRPRSARRNRAQFFE